MIRFRHFLSSRKTAILLVWLSIEKRGFFNYRSFHKSTYVALDDIKKGGKFPKVSD